MTSPDPDSPNATGPVDYASNLTPTNYYCRECKAAGLKLWREYNTFLDHQTFFCAACAMRNQEKPGEVGPDGKREEDGRRTDQIGWLIPAVPTEDGSSFWGYTSVPQAGCDWWYRLPTRLVDR